MSIQQAALAAAEEESVQTEDNSPRSSSTCTHMANASRLLRKGCSTLQEMTEALSFSPRQLNSQTISFLPRRISF
jgi:hypothetical protein